MRGCRWPEVALFHFACKVVLKLCYPQTMGGVLCVMVERGLRGMLPVSFFLCKTKLLRASCCAINLQPVRSRDLSSGEF